MQRSSVLKVTRIALFALVVTLAQRLLGEAADKSSEIRSRLVAAKASLMSADYRADLAALSSLRIRVAAMRDDPSLGYLAYYWTGYASWRLALNGASARMSQEDLKAHLERSAADFEASLARKDDFADAYAAAASVHGWLLTFYLDNPAVRRLHAERAGRFLARAKELGPSNPRVLWVDGGNLLFKPAAYGGNFEAGMQIYRRIAASPDSLTPESPFPDWGKAEAVMSLAYGHLNQTTPDLDAATEEASEALRLQPDWFYVRDILMPQIDARRKNGSAPAQCRSQ
jgi:hypothetical protein